MAENIEKQKEKRSLPFGRLIKKNLLLMVLITVLCSLLATAYAIVFVKPTYTATSSVILRMSVTSQNQSNAQTDLSLAQRYLPTIADLVASPEIVDKANKIYHEDESISESDKINAGAVKIDYNERSMIFTISYTDSTPDRARAKVEAIRDAASQNFEWGILGVKSVALIPTDNEIDEPEAKSGHFKFIVSGIAIGVVASFVVVLLKYALDNTITEKKEFEELTGVDVLATIDKQN